MSRKTKYNLITSEEKIAQINSENMALCRDYLEYLKSTDHAPLTIKGYKNDLDIFFVWNLEHNDNKFFVDIKKRELTRFQGHCLEKWGWSPNRVRRMKSVISSLSTYIEDILQDEDEAFEDFRSIIGKIKSPEKEAVREKTVLTDEEIEEFLERLVEEEKYQQACVVALAAYSGARKAELLLFKPDFFVDENIIFDSLYKTPKIRTKGHGVKGKCINKYVLIDFKKYFDLWMQKRNELGVESEWLFVTKNQMGEWEQMKVSRLNSWAITFSEMLGKDFYFHSLRHFLTSKMKRYNIPDNVIQEFFMWSSAEMVGIYNDNEASEEFGKYFSKDGMIEGKSGSLGDL